MIDNIIKLKYISKGYRGINLNKVEQLSSLISDFKREYPDEEIGVRLIDYLDALKERRSIKKFIHEFKNDEEIIIPYLDGKSTDNNNLKIYYYITSSPKNPPLKILSKFRSYIKSQLELIISKNSKPSLDLRACFKGLKFLKEEDITFRGLERDLEVLDSVSKHCKLSSCTRKRDTLI